MKKHSFVFKIFSMLISFVMMFFGARADVFAAARTVTTTKSCAYGLCSKKLILSGPYGNANDVVDSSIPYLGGRTYYDVYHNDYDSRDDFEKRYHMYVVYCPKYDRSSSSLFRHTMSLFFPEHGLTFTGYSQFNSSSHYVNYVCDHGLSIGGTYCLTQHLCGENSRLTEEEIKNIIMAYDNGCGETVSELESHTWSYGSWSYDGSYHFRDRTCSKCGYKVTERYGHSISYGYWIKTATQHSRTVSCATCGYSTTESASHSWTYSSSTSIGSTQHKYTRTCSVCGYSETVSENHSLSYGQWYRYADDEQRALDSSAPDSLNNHARKVTCSKCGYTGYQYQSHNLTIRDPSDISRYINPDVGYYLYGDYHYYTETCSVCSYRIAHYSRHTFGSSNYTYKNSSVHLVSKPCTSCDYVDNYDEAHNYTNVYTPYSDTQHKLTKTCVCGDKIISYSNHRDDNGDNICDDCGYVMSHFSVTVPTSMTISVDKNGKTYSASNVSIANNSTGAVKVTSINLTGKNGWKIVPYSTNMANEKVDAKKIGLKIGNSVSTSGSAMQMSGNWTIAKNSSLALSYGAVVSATSSPVTDQNVIDITFVIDWSDA